MASIPHETMMRIIGMGRPPQLEHGPAYDAVFDPFQCDGEEFYRYYDASTECWMIGRPLQQSERTQREIQGEDYICGTPDEITALHSLSFMPPPPYPDKFQEPLFRGPFWHGERRFAWLLSMEAGWRLYICESGPPPENAGYQPIVAATT